MLTKMINRNRLAFKLIALSKIVEGKYRVKELGILDLQGGKVHVSPSEELINLKLDRTNF
jgi:hypothetical protein